MTLEAVAAIAGSAVVAFGVLFLKDRLSVGSAVSRELGQLTAAITGAVTRLDKFEESVEKLAAAVAPLAAADTALREVLQHHYVTRDETRAAFRTHRHGVRQWFTALIHNLELAGVDVKVPKELLDDWGDEFMQRRIGDRGIHGS